MTNLNSIINESQGISAIDVHGHYGNYVREDYGIMNDFMSASYEEILKRASSCNIIKTIVSPLSGLLPRFKSNPIEANEETAEIVNKNEALLQWVVLNPLIPETFKQCDKMLKNPKCIGIKIHPEEHGYKIKNYIDKIMEFSSEYNATILSHSGEPNSMPEDFVDGANKFSKINLILAHLGCGFDNNPTHQIKAILRSKHNNIYTDTSSANNLLPNIIEWAVNEVGSERILFGSDSPLYFLPMQRARIDKAEIDLNHKQNILYNNATKMFNIERTIDA